MSTQRLQSMGKIQLEKKNWTKIYKGLRYVFDTVTEGMESMTV